MSLANFPNEYPEFTLDFRNARTLDPRITFSRASTATYIDDEGEVVTSHADAPRFTPNGLLIEESRTNQCKASEDMTFPNQAWSLNAATITVNATTAPDGTTTADALFETTASADHRLQYATQIFKNISTSLFVKPNGRDYVSARILAAGNQWATVVFELIGDGAITKIEDGSTNLITHVGSSIEAVANGWYRISITTNRTSSTAQYPILFGTCTTANPTLDAILGAEIFAGDTSKGIYVWGVQFEYEQGFPTSYIPTSGSAATRAQDLVSIPSTDLIDPSQGTFVWDVTPFNDSFSGEYAFMATDTGTDNSLISVAGSSYTFAVYDALSLEAQIDYSSTYQTDTNVRAAAAYATDDVALATDGVIRGTDSNASMPATIDELYLFRRENNVTSSRMSGHFNRISYYSTRLSDSALRALSPAP